MQQFDAIIFDLGNVLIDIDFDKTNQAFQQLGAKEFNDANSLATNNQFFHDFETGLLSPAYFVNTIQQTLPTASDCAIVDAWNALLGQWRIKSLQHLKKLSATHRLFLLSNTNQIHYDAFINSFVLETGESSFEAHFEKAYFSHELHKRKPNADAYQYIIDTHQLNAQRTIFVDDLKKNIEAAKLVGLKTLWLQSGDYVENYSF
jgi:glucose-1-phosphatase